MEILSQISHIIYLIFILLLLVFGVRYIFKSPYKLKEYQITLVMFIIFLVWILNFFEKTCGQGTSSKYFYQIHPLGNLSPFLFFMTFIFMFMPHKIKKYFYAVIATIMLGMVGAGLKNIGELAILGGKYLYTCVVYDCLGHILMFLLGLYLIKNEVIEYNKKEQIFAYSFIFGIAIIALICNIIFDTSFFGLNLNGKHNIYGLILTSNSYLSALIYFSCLTVIVIGGNHFIRFILKRKKR